MTDLHMHTLLSDGVLLPSELARRAEERGLEIIAMTDHVDASNIEPVVASVVNVCREINTTCRIRAIPGVEITHVHPSRIGHLAEKARRLGAVVVVVHGETPVEPVAAGTNTAALDGDVDILAHPGCLSEDDARRAAERDICIEITSRQGHSLGNGRVARLWYEYRFPLVLNSDTHGPADILTGQFARKVLEGAGIHASDVDHVLASCTRRAEIFLRRFS